MFLFTKLISHVMIEDRQTGGNFPPNTSGLISGLVEILAFNLICLFSRVLTLFLAFWFEHVCVWRLRLWPSDSFLLSQKFIWYTVNVLNFTGWHFRGFLNSDLFAGCNIRTCILYIIKLTIRSKYILFLRVVQIFEEKFLSQNKRKLVHHE